MAVSLLKLDSGHYSLEFEPNDIARVAEVLREAFGPPATKRWPVATSYSLKGVELTYQNERDDPCLIASDDAGDEILRSVQERLSQTQA